MAATVRQVSNSRTSTFKLHTSAPDVLAKRSIDALAEFKKIAADNIAEATAQRNQLAKAGLLTRSGHYSGRTNKRLADVRTLSRSAKEKADLLMTSPPYGDNRTTVPYGQYAFLPLQWIDPNDLDGGDGLTELIGNPYRTDVASLGGKASPDLMDRIAQLAEGSDSVRATVKLLKDLPGDGLRRFATFICDLDDAMHKINRQLRPGAFQFWTLGERSISGSRIPTTQIVTELAALQDCSHVVTLARSIPNGRKRMAIRNDTVATIRAESILVLQRAAAP
jgi:site-specific DNA-methyltransferase (cytosine-N4-specific)